jgi:hypothetical protein
LIISYLDIGVDDSSIEGFIPRARVYPGAPPRGGIVII